MNGVVATDDLRAAVVRGIERYQARGGAIPKPAADRPISELKLVDDIVDELHAIEELIADEIVAALSRKREERLGD